MCRCFDIFSHLSPIECKSESVDVNPEAVAIVKIGFALHISNRSWIIEAWWRFDRIATNSSFHNNTHIGRSYHLIVVHAAIHNSPVLRLIRALFERADEEQPIVYCCMSNNQLMWADNVSNNNKKWENNVYNHIKSTFFCQPLFFIYMFI